MRRRWADSTLRCACGEGQGGGVHAHECSQQPPTQPSPRKRDDGAHRVRGQALDDHALHPRLRQSLEAVRRGDRGATRSISRLPRARRSASSDLTAPARPRCSVSRAARCGPTPGASSSRAVTSPRFAPERRCRMGIGRSFQIPQPFNGMSVFENLVVAAAFGGGRSERDAYPRCVELLEQCGLADKANRPAGRLTLLDRKRLELAPRARDAAAAASPRRGRRRPDRARMHGAGRL